MGNSQQKEGKGTKTKERNKKEEEESNEEECGEIENEASAYIEKDVVYELPNGTESTLNLRPPLTITLKSFKEDIQSRLHTNKRIEVYRDNLNQPLGPDHLTLQTLHIDSGDPPLKIRQFDD